MEELRLVIYENIYAFSMKEESNWQIKKSFASKFSWLESLRKDVLNEPVISIISGMKPKKFRRQRFQHRFSSFGIHWLEQ